MELPFGETYDDPDEPFADREHRRAWRTWLTGLRSDDELSVVVDALMRGEELDDASALRWARYKHFWRKQTPLSNALLDLTGGTIPGYPPPGWMWTDNEVLLFDGFPAWVRAKTITQGQRLLARRRIHPTGRLMATAREHMGRNCGHCEHRTEPGRYIKCNLDRRDKGGHGWTRGLGTDIRAKWPACNKFVEG